MAQLEQLTFDALSKEHKLAGVIAYSNKTGPCAYCSEPTKLIFPPISQSWQFVKYIKACISCRGGVGCENNPDEVSA
jgi:hypothetical protein